MLSPRPRTRPWPKRGRAHCQSAKFVVGTTTVSNRNRYPNFGPWPTSKSSAGAFATGSLGWVSEFHLSPASTPAVELLLASIRPGGCARVLLPKKALWALRLKRGPRTSARQLRKAAHGLSRLGTFNRSNNLVGSLPWYYRACWHQNLAQIAFAGLSITRSSRRPKTIGGPLTISAQGHWIVFVPAASLGHESCLSGFLCGIGP